MTRLVRAVLRQVAYKHQLHAGLARGRVLDVGYAQHPNQHLSGAVGIDVQTRECPKNYSSVFAVNLNSTKPWPFRARSFDTVILGDVIEHVENPCGVLREVNRVLRPSGILILSTPCATYYWTVVDDWLLRNRFADPDHGEHLQNWTRRDMTRLLKKNGFCDVMLHGSGAIIPVIHSFVPNKPFPWLGWTITYAATKQASPSNTVITSTHYGTTENTEVKQ